MSLLEARGVATSFTSGNGRLRAVNGVDISLDRGHVLGLVGESGSGKSVFVRSIMGLYRLDARAECKGLIEFDNIALERLPEKALRRLWGKRIAIVFQDPMSSLNPVVRVGRQIAETVRHHLGLSRSAALGRAVELLRAVEIPDPERRLSEYPHQLSGGMRQRIAIAIALAGEPELLIADEPTTALDVTVQAQVLRLLRDLQVRRNMAMILVSHDLGVVGSVADEIAVMYAGRVIERGARELVIEHPRHPYTHALLRSVPRLDLPLGSRLLGIKGRPPDLRSVPPGCAFAPRCEYADEVCREMAPSLAPEAEGRLVACWKPVAGADNAARIGGAGADYAGE